MCILRAAGGGREAEGLIAEDFGVRGLGESEEHKGTAEDGGNPADQAPADYVGDGAAEEGAEGRAEERDGVDEGEGLAKLLGRPDVAGDGKDGDEVDAAANAGQETGRDEGGFVVEDTAHHAPSTVDEAAHDSDLAYGRTSL